MSETPKNPETELWLAGTVESAISKELLILLHGTGQKVRIVVNSGTQFPIKKSPISGVEAPTRPSSIDSEGNKRLVEFAVTGKYAETLSQQIKNGENGVIPFVHAAKFAQHRTDFLPRATVEETAKYLDKVNGGGLHLAANNQDASVEDDGVLPAALRELPRVVEPVAHKATSDVRIAAAEQMGAE